jgi:hypothetical protein
MIFAASAAFYLLMPFVYCFVLIVLAVAFLVLFDKIFRRRPSKAQLAAHAKRFAERLKNPNFAGLEAHFGHSLPLGIKALYQDQEELYRSDFEVAGKGTEGVERTWFVAYYQPADLENIRDAWPDTRQVFEIANDGCGNGYTIDPKIENPPVMFYDHETGVWDKVADSFLEFMAMERRQPKE